MNLNELFNIQEKLDERIVEEHGLQGEELMDKKILALQVELGELANEWRGFKFWSKDQKARTFEKCHVCQGHGETIVPAFPDFEEMEQDMCPVCEGEGTTDKNPLLEEYVDCLHFILSIGLEHEFDDISPVLAIESIAFSKIEHQFTALMKTDWDIYEAGDGGYFHEGLELFLGLGEMLGFTWEQIEQAYLEKNQINHERQSEGY